MKYNPEIHHRQSIRLKDYDYSQNGAYFITICTANREHLFGEIVNEKMLLNEYGIIVDDCISKIEVFYKGTEITARAVMPNHIHFIVEMFDTASYAAVQSHVGDAYYAAQEESKLPALEISFQYKSKMPLPKIIQQFKSATVKQCGNTVLGLHTMQPLRWQRNYYEHIIRNQEEYITIGEYIRTNPQKWGTDIYY